MKKILTTIFVLFLVACNEKGSLISDASRDLAGQNEQNKATATPTATPTGTTTATATPTPTPTNPASGGGSGAGTAPGCTATANVLCKGGYDSDNTRKSLKVKVVYGNPAGTRLTTDPLTHARNFINKVNANYVHDGHRYMNLALDEAKVIEVAQESDTTMISKYAEDGYVTMILVASIPGNTVGYVQNMCAELQKKQAWTIFEFPYVANGVVEHEINHLFCFPHTSSQNGGNPSQFLAGYNTMQSILTAVGAYKKAFTPAFKLYIDGANRSNASVTQDNMLYFTGNLMYYSILPTKPKLFTPEGDGYPYSYSHLLDYYYWNFIKPYAK